MSGREKFVPPPPLTGEQLQELAEEAAAAGAVVTDGWDLARTLDVVREQWARNRGEFLAQQERYHGGIVREELDRYGSPQIIGEALLHSAALTAALVMQGADAQSVINVLSFAGYALHQGEMP